MSDTVRPEARLGDDSSADDLPMLDLEVVKADFSFVEIEPGTDEFAAASRAFERRSLAYRVVKRTADILFSLLIIIFGLLPAFILSLFVWIDTGASPIYTQTRAGRFGVPFKIHKFRTMVADSDDIEKYLNEDQLAMWRKERKVDDDPRITRLGRFLRATSVDELPNFLDVFTGELSIVGPRAISFSEVTWFGNDQAELLSVRPGITGLWQAGPRNRATFESGQRQALELDYVRRAGLGLDLSVFFHTFGAVFGGTGK